MVWDLTLVCQELIENIVKERQVWGPDPQFGSLSKTIIKDYNNCNAMAVFYLKVAGLFLSFFFQTLVLYFWITFLAVEHKQVANVCLRTLQLL